jgi:lipopolysaccharide transport system permease protein
LNPHARAPLAPQALLLSLWQHRGLIAQLTQREVLGRYKGSLLGLGWSIITPLLMLAVYTFVFGTVFKARWGVDPDSFAQGKVGFALIMFVGLVLHGWLGDVASRAPMLIVGQTNYVKKVVFPLEVLPVVGLLAASFHAAVGILVLLGGVLLTVGSLPISALATPLVLLPYMLALTGICWALASLGVYLRDIGQTVGFVVLVLMFLSPVFYPVSALPADMQAWAHWNPLTFPIEQVRATLLFGQWPDWVNLGLFWLGCAAVAWLGFAAFQRTRQGFADVL